MTMIAIAALISAFSFNSPVSAESKSAIDSSRRGFAAIANGEWREAGAAFHDSYQRAKARGNNTLAAKSAFNEAVVGQRLVVRVDSSIEWFSATRGAGRQGQELASESIDVTKTATEAASLASQVRDFDLQAKATALAVSYDPGVIADDDAVRLLEKAAKKVEGSSESLIKLTEASITRFARSRDSRFSSLAFRAYVLTEKVATEQNDRRSLAMATGLLARLYGLSGRAPEALTLTSDALIWANQVGDVETELELQIQRAALLEKIGDAKSALDAYEQATELVEIVRPVLAKRSNLEAHSALRGLIQAALFARADLLLKLDGDNPDTLKKVRKLLELNKLVDLEFYFSAPCVRLGAGMIRDLEQVGPGVAVIYPVLLRDRTEVIVGTAEGIKRYTSSVAGADVLSLATAYEAGLQPPEELQADAPNEGFMRSSQRLYGILVAPAAAQLKKENIHTLVFAPDTGLRGVPLAALHDGNGYLIETYAVATALGLGLVDPTPFDRSDPRAVLAGLSQAPFGMAPLASVPKELTDIGSVIPEHVELLNAHFTEDQLRQALKKVSPNIVHLATHTRFYRLQEDNLLLTYDNGITPAQLGKMITEIEGPRHLEILGMSACQTAVGDDDALMGMAGVAYQSGARSVVGSLWKVSDRSTAELMPLFYNNVIGKGESKAEAMRQAQLELLGQDSTRHPYHWAAFILLGNWL